MKTNNDLKQTHFNWISVDESLPRHKEVVLVKTKKNLFCVVIHLLKDEVIKEMQADEEIPNEWGDDIPDGVPIFASIERSGNILASVTHWIHLPSIDQ